MKNALDGLISRLDVTEQRISELRILAIETSKTEKERKKDWKEKKIEQNIQALWDIYNRSNMHIMGIPEGEETFEIRMIKNVPQSNVRRQTTDPGSSENSKQDK